MDSPFIQLIRILSNLLNVSQNLIHIYQFKLILSVTPGITATEYAARRSQLASIIPSHSLIVLIGAQIMYKTASTL